MSPKAAYDRIVASPEARDDGVAACWAPDASKGRVPNAGVDGVRAWLPAQTDKKYISIGRTQSQKYTLWGHTDQKAIATCRIMKSSHQTLLWVYCWMQQPAGQSGSYLQHQEMQKTQSCPTVRLQSRCQLAQLVVRMQMQMRQRGLHGSRNISGDAVIVAGNNVSCQGRRPCLFSL